VPADPDSHAQSSDHRCPGCHRDQDPDGPGRLRRRRRHLNNDGWPLRALDRHDQAVASSRNGLNESWVGRIVAYRQAQPVHRCIESMLEFDESIVAPQFCTECFARNYLAGMIQ
jgi:hypothetical protein